MSDTPRTDSTWHLCVELEARTPLRDLSMKLERELAEAKADAESWREQAERLGQQLLEANEKLKLLLK